MYKLFEKFGNHCIIDYLYRDLVTEETDIQLQQQNYFRRTTSLHEINAVR